MEENVMKRAGLLQNALYVNEKAAKNENCL